MTRSYAPHEPARAEVDALRGPAMLEFGSPTCGWCYAAQGPIAEAMEGHGGVRHIKVADGRGRPLGRSFGVKLWPTLVFLENGAESARLVRPDDAGEILRELDRIDPSKEWERN